MLLSTMVPWEAAIVELNARNVTSHKLKTQKLWLDIGLILFILKLSIVVELPSQRGPYSTGFNFQKEAWQWAIYDINGGYK